MSAGQLPALVVVIPLLAGVGAAVSGRGNRAWLLAVAATWATFSIALQLAVVVHAQGPVSYAMGGWPDPTGIELRVDRLSALVLCVVSGIAAAVTPFARLSVAREVPEDRQHFFYAAFLLCVTGLLGITATGDAFNLYVLLEISSLTAYALVAMGKGRDRRALTAAFQYLVMGSVGASFLLVGIGYLFLATGTLNMADMAERIAELHDSRTVRTGFAFVLVGLSLKMALFPVHQWLPNAYTYAPTAVSALLAATATKVAIYVAIRFTYTIFGPELSFELPTDTILIGSSLLAILFGSLLAIRQTELKRLLAYSSVAQIGYLVLGFSLGNADGVTGSLLHLVNHALVKGALFMAAGAVLYRTGGARLADLSGLGRRMPLTAAALTIGGLGLVGVPLTGGFVSKWFLVAGALKAGLWPVAVVVLLGSLLAVIYVLRFLQPLYFGPADFDREPSEAPPSFVIPTLVLLAGSLLLGVSGPIARGIVRSAAAALTGEGAP